MYFILQHTQRSETRCAVDSSSTAIRIAPPNEGDGLLTQTVTSKEVTALQIKLTT